MELCPWSRTGYRVPVIRGEIETLPSGSLRVRVYDGVDPATGRRRYLSETVPAGPAARLIAAEVRDRLLAEAAHRRAGRAATARTAPARTAAPRPGRRRGELTLSSIARLAGVSAPTVSKVLNGHQGVATATRVRVEELLREHGYRRPGAVPRSPLVEVVFYGMQSALAIEVLHGVEQVAGEQRLAVGFVDVMRQMAAGRSWPEDLLRRRPAGVITVNLGFSGGPQSLLRAGAIPLVALDPTDQPGAGVPSVGATNWSGGLDAARHLLDLGHRRIALITGPPDRLAARARLDGIRAALTGAGVPPDERLTRTGRSFTVDDGLDHARELLRLPARPTAVICGNDLQAFGVYAAAAESGLRVPDDLSVVGFDDLEYAGWSGPPLTTVRQPFAEMGAAAARMVLALAAGEPPERTRRELQTTLVVRGSTAPPPPAR